MTGHCSRKVDCFTYNVTLKWVFGLVQTFNFSCFPFLSICPFPSFPLFLFHSISSSHIPCVLNTVSSKIKNIYSDVCEHISATVWNHNLPSQVVCVLICRNCMLNYSRCAIICNIVWEMHIHPPHCEKKNVIAFPTNENAAPHSELLMVARSKDNI